MKPEILFSDRLLIKKFGSWMRVQVAFYDWLFTSGTKMCPTHWKQVAISGFKDGADFYEYSVKKIESAFPSFEKAWQAFKKDSL